MEEALVREGERVQRLRDEHEGIERQTKALVDQEQQLMARRETELNKYVEHLNRGARQMHRDMSKSRARHLPRHSTRSTAAFHPAFDPEHRHFCRAGLRHALPCRRSARSRS